MLIDCDTCTARPRACGDCIVTHLLSVGPVRGRSDDSFPDPVDLGDVGPPPDDAWPEPAELDEREIAAVGVLAAGGLVPPLRLVTAPEPPVTTRHTRSAPRRRSLGSGSQAG